MYFQRIQLVRQCPLLIMLEMLIIRAWDAHCSQSCPPPKCSWIPRFSCCYISQHSRVLPPIPRNGFLGSVRDHYKKSLMRGWNITEEKLTFKSASQLSQYKPLNNVQCYSSKCRFLLLTTFPASIYGLKSGKKASHKLHSTNSQYSKKQKV